jgi:prolyl-tRNA editing enzyme YbaK/EbsC (Cys-tRNA(Pro) deacylase)
MNKDLKLAKSAQNIQDVLKKNGLDCTVIELSSSARTAQEAATALGCTVAQIVKSLIFKTEHTGQPVLILASGSNHVDENIIQKIIGEKIMKADAGFVREVTGYAIGGVPPIGHKQPIELLFIDEDLLKFDSLWAAAGTPHAVFNFSSNQLLHLTKGKVIAIY